MIGKFKEVQFNIENQFATSNKSSEELNITVFDRAFRKLTKENSSVGKIFPLYIKIDNKCYVFGIFALSCSGSTSFFLELPGNMFFDHITFGKRLDKNKAHLTRLAENGHKKVSSLSLDLLSNDSFHAITIIIQDLKLLKMAPRTVVYPSVDFKKFELLKDALSTKGTYNGFGLLEVAGSSGPVIIQIFVIPIEFDCRNLQITKSSFAQFAQKFKDKELLDAKRHISCLEHEFQKEYKFGIVACRYPGNVNCPFYFGYAMEKNGLYFNSSDSELDEQVHKINKKTK